MQPDSNSVVRANGFLGTRAIFEVAEGFIGMPSRGKQVAGVGGWDCGYLFQRGEKYIVYASESNDGTFVASICSRTTPEDRAPGAI
jgi:hypothetical protein